MKKKVIVGYVGRGADAMRIYDGKGGVSLHGYLINRRGNKKNWATYEWPPKKVRITIEEL